jgi:hypothetical protein
MIAPEPVRSRFCGWRMVFWLQDRGLLPEASLDLQGHDLASPIGKCSGEDIG